MAEQYRRRGSRRSLEINEDIQDLPASRRSVSYDNAFNVVGAHRPKETKGRS